jgi:hypothetical protein
MKPILLFPIAILTPFLLTFALLAPIYVALSAAAYIVYMPAAGAHPLTPRLLDIFYMFDVYTKLLEYWLQQHATLSFVHYTLPVVVLPLLGVLVALFATYKIASGLLNIFRLSTPH